MNDSKIIQFARLEEFLEEDLHEGNPVRVVVLEITESVSSQIPGLRNVGIGVHVRAINDAGHILACYLPTGRLQLYNGRREGDPTWQEYDAVWEKAEALKERVLKYLQMASAEKGFTVRGTGIIDTSTGSAQALGQARPLRATWKSDPGWTLPD
jgi:hypothetical protein